jgi:squamous cell carcinoma antigen recognized by T-cells 3
MEETYAEFSTFVGKFSNDTYEATMSSTSKGYGKALKALREREVFELQLIQSHNSYEIFSAYLNWEQSSSPKSHNPRLVQMLFERALAIHWQQQSTWEDYAYYAVSSLPC